MSKPTYAKIPRQWPLLLSFSLCAHVSKDNLVSEHVLKTKSYSALVLREFLIFTETRNGPKGKHVYFPSKKKERRRAPEADNRQLGVYSVLLQVGIDYLLSARSGSDWWFLQSSFTSWRQVKSSLGEVSTNFVLHYSLITASSRSAGIGVKRAWCIESLNSNTVLSCEHAK